MLDRIETWAKDNIFMKQKHRVMCPIKKKKKIVIE